MESQGIQWCFRTGNRRICWIIDHDDILGPNALFEVTKALQKKKYDILYTDEDKVSGDLSEHMDPNFKPDWSPDLFYSHNYITHFFVVKKEIIDKIGGFRSEYDGSQDYDLMFRCIENVGKHQTYSDDFIPLENAWRISC